MPLVGCVITHAGGTRTVTNASVPARSRAFAQQAVVPYEESMAVLEGDGNETPTPYTVVLRVFGTTASGLPGAYHLARTIVEEARTATLVQTHDGFVTVDGLLGYGIAPYLTGAELTLEFAPTTGTITPGYVL